MSRSKVSSFLFSFFARILRLLGNRNRRNSQSSQLRQIIEVDGSFDRHYRELLWSRRDNCESGDFALIDSSVDLTDLALTLRGDNLAPSGSTKLGANWFQIFDPVLAGFVELETSDCDRLEPVEQLLEFLCVFTVFTVFAG